MDVDQVFQGQATVDEVLDGLLTVSLHVRADPVAMVGHLVHHLPVGSTEADIVLDHSLYEAKPKDYIDTVETLSDRYGSVLIVGHNPTIEETIQMLTDSSDVAMPSCALAHFSLQIEKWSDFSKAKTKQRVVVLNDIVQP